MCSHVSGHLTNIGLLSEFLQLLNSPQKNINSSAHRWTLILQRHTGVINRFFKLARAVNAVICCTGPCYVCVLIKTCMPSLCVWDIWGPCFFFTLLLWCVLAAGCLHWRAPSGCSTCPWLLKAALLVVNAVDRDHRPVLVHCSERLGPHASDRRFVQTAAGPLLSYHRGTHNTDSLLLATALVRTIFKCFISGTYYISPENSWRLKLTPQCCWENK